MLTRRKLIQRLSALPRAGGILGSSFPLAALAASGAPKPKRDLFKELGFRTFINAPGSLTYMTASLMQEEVLEAINGAAKGFCILDELQDTAGERIAKM